MSHCRPARLTRATGAIALARQQHGIRTVALCTPVLDIDLTPLAQALQSAIDALQPIEAVSPDTHLAPPHLDRSVHAAPLATTPVQILPAPALLRRPETPSRVNAADSVLLLVLAGRSNAEHVRQAIDALRELPDTPFLGTIAAECRNPVPWVLRALLGVPR